MTVQVFSGSSFQELGHYLEYGNGASYVEDPSERVAWDHARNVPDEKRRHIVSAMRVVAGENKRGAGGPLHLVISWKSLSQRELIQGTRRADRPSHEAMRRTAERVLEDPRVGLGDHQAWIVAHSDTDTPHLHVMVNRVHPETKKAWNGWKSIQRINQVLREIERERQWHTPHRGRELAEKGYVEERGFKRNRQRAGQRQPALEAAARAAAGEELSGAGSWAEVESALKQYGLEAVPKRSGFVVTDGERYAKMSSVTGGVSKAAWEAQFGTTWEEHAAERDAGLRGRHREPKAPAFSEEIDAEAFARSEQGQALRWANEYYQKQLRDLPEGHPVKAYLRERGIDEEMQRRFDVGYAPERWRAAVRAGKAAGFSEETLREAGLTRFRGDGKKQIDYFRSRITLPIKDEEGRVRGFAGRQGAEGYEPSASPGRGKYVNSPKSEHFDKGTLAHGLHKARSSIEKSGGAAMIVEGYWDAMTLHKEGQTNAVALMGTRLKPELAGRMKKAGIESATLVLDGDDEGRAAARQAQETLVRKGVWAERAELPEGRDPDEMLQREGGRGAFAESVTERKDYVQTAVEDALRGRPRQEQAEARTRAHRRIMETAVQAPPATRRRLLERLVEHDRRHRRGVPERTKNAGERALRGAIVQEMKKRGVEGAGFREERVPGAEPREPSREGPEAGRAGGPDAREAYREQFGRPALAGGPATEGDGTECAPAKPLSPQSRLRRRRKLQGRAAWLEGRLSRLEQRREERERTAIRARALQAQDRFERSLAAVYASPVEARRRFRALNRKHPFKKVMRQVRAEPRTLGMLRKGREQAWERDKSRLTGEIENRSREHLALAAAAAKVTEVQDYNRRAGRDAERSAFLQEEVQRSAGRIWNDPEKAAGRVQAHQQEHGWEATWEKLGRVPEAFGLLDAERLRGASGELTTEQAARVEGERIAGVMQAGRRIREEGRLREQEKGFAERTMYQAQVEMKRLGARVSDVPASPTGGEKALWEKERAQLKSQLAQTRAEIRTLSTRRSLEAESSHIEASPPKQLTQEHTLMPNQANDERIETNRPEGRRPAQQEERTALAELSSQRLPEDQRQVGSGRAEASDAERHAEAPSVDTEKVEQSRERIERYASHQQAEQRQEEALGAGDTARAEAALEEKRACGDGPTLRAEAHQAWERLSGAERRRVHGQLSEGGKQIVEAHEGMKALREHASSLQQGTGGPEGASREGAGEKAVRKARGQKRSGVPERPFRRKYSGKLRFGMTVGKEMGQMMGAKEAGEDPTEVAESVARVGEAAIKAGSEARDNKRMKEAIAQANARANYYESQMEHSRVQEQAASGTGTSRGHGSGQRPEGRAQSRSDGRAEEGRDTAPTGRSPEAGGGEGRQASVSENAPDEVHTKEALGEYTQDVVGGPEEDAPVKSTQVKNTQMENSLTQAQMDSVAEDVQRFSRRYERAERVEQDLKGKAQELGAAKKEMRRLRTGDAPEEQVQAARNKVDRINEERREMAHRLNGSGRSEKVGADLHRNAVKLQERFGDRSFSRALKSGTVPNGKGGRRTLSRAEKATARKALRAGRNSMSKQAERKIAPAISKARTVGKAVAGQNEEGMGLG